MLKLVLLKVVEAHCILVVEHKKIARTLCIYTPYLNIREGRFSSMPGFVLPLS
jgi:hypothetical protein